MLELADIVRAAGEDYQQRPGAPLLPSHRRALRDLVACRTAALGGHVQACDHCGTQQSRYPSGRHRHCPKCHGEQTERRLDRERARLLPCASFLLTFTLPAELRALARRHQKLVYGVLMTAAAAALLKLTADPHYLGARPGLLAVLHTWTRALLYHPHVHMLVTTGGLRGPDQTWVRPRHAAFLVPGRALSRLFRGKVRAGLRTAGLLEQVPEAVWRHEWLVHVQHAGTGEQVLAYLARYIFRIAIVNSRLEQFEDGRVTFRYREGGRASSGGAPSTPSRSSTAFCSTCCRKASPRSATTACSVRRVTTCWPTRASSSLPLRPRRQPIGRRSPPRPRPRRPAYRLGAARHAGSGCCTSSRPFARVGSRPDHAPARPTASIAGAPSPCGGCRRRLSRGSPARSQPAPARFFRAGSTVAVTARSSSRDVDALSSAPSNALESPSVSPTAGSSSTPPFAAASRGKKP